MSRGSKVGGTKRRVLDIVGFAAIVVLFLLYMVPFILVLLNSFKQKRDIIKNPFSFITEKGYTLANYTKAFEKMEFVKAFGNSLFITGLSTLLVIIFASMVAYYFTRAKNTFSRVFFALMAASMIIPFQAIMIPLVSIYGSGLHMLNHRLTLIFMHTGFAMSMSVFIYQGFIKSGIPLSLEAAAGLMRECCIIHHRSGAVTIRMRLSVLKYSMEHPLPIRPARSVPMCRQFRTIRPEE